MKTETFNRVKSVIKTLEQLKEQLNVIEYENHLSLHNNSTDSFCCNLDEYDKEYFIDKIKSKIEILENEFDKLTGNKPAGNQWISCSDRLPELYNNVLVTILSDDGYKIIDIMSRYEDDTNDGKWCWTTSLGTHTVIAWQELPPIYEGDIQ